MVYSFFKIIIAYQKESTKEPNSEKEKESDQQTSSMKWKFIFYPKLLQENNNQSKQYTPPK